MTLIVLFGFILLGDSKKNNKLRDGKAKINKIKPGIIVQNISSDLFSRYFKEENIFIQQNLNIKNTNTATKINIHIPKS